MACEKHPGFEFFVDSRGHETIQEFPLGGHSNWDAYGFRGIVYNGTKAGSGGRPPMPSPQHFPMGAAPMYFPPYGMYPPPSFLGYQSPFAQMPYPFHPTSYAYPPNVSPMPMPMPMPVAPVPPSPTSRQAAKNSSEGFPSMTRRTAGRYYESADTEYVDDPFV